ncbi:MAG: glycosyltransferase family 9 protein [Candidatus Tantalella remota]|nr:glycosyltransferase family 9 protein [Candidatus Tantalella remota]
MTEPKRILVFELNWMGDILFSFPFHRALRERFPDAYICCVTVPRYVELFLNNPWINFAHVLSDARDMFSINEKMAFVKMIRKEKYDTCFLLKPSRTKAMMAAFAGIGERIGFSGKKGALTKEVAPPSREIHRADQILSLAGVAGVKEANGSYVYFVTPEDSERADKVLRHAGGGSRRMVALNTGGNWDAKKWAGSNFIELAKKILDRFDDVEIMFTGAMKDMITTQEMVASVSDERCYTVAGRTGLNELASLFKKCELVVSADSGPLHLASATGTTTIGLYGPTSRNITGPRGEGKNIVISKDIDCEVPCYVAECDKEFMCMRSIPVEEVFAVLEVELRG